MDVHNTGLNLLLESYTTVLYNFVHCTQNERNCYRFVVNIIFIGATTSTFKLSCSFDQNNSARSVSE